MAQTLLIVQTGNGADLDRFQSRMKPSGG